MLPCGWHQKNATRANFKKSRMVTIGSPGVAICIGGQAVVDELAPIRRGPPRFLDKHGDSRLIMRALL